MPNPRYPPLIPRRQFFGRLTKHAMGGLAILAMALAAGMAGYHWLEGLPWIDSFMNAAMILGGMGPVAELHTSGGKLFAGMYALFAGMVFLAVVGVVFSPVVHRAMNRFHLDDDALPPAPSRRPVT
jgi:hypothetical protein